MFSSTVTYKESLFSLQLSRQTVFRLIARIFKKGMTNWAILYWDNLRYENTCTGTMHTL